jgi:hypothetical protein
MSNLLTGEDAMPPDLRSGSGDPEHHKAVAEPTLLGTLQTFRESIASLYMLSEGAVKPNEAGSSGQSTKFERLSVFD